MYRLIVIAFLATLLMGNSYQGILQYSEYSPCGSHVYIDNCEGGCPIWLVFSDQDNGKFNEPVRIYGRIEYRGNCFIFYVQKMEYMNRRKADWF